MAHRKCARAHRFWLLRSVLLVSAYMVVEKVAAVETQRVIVQLVPAAENSGGSVHVAAAAAAAGAANLQPLAPDLNLYTLELRAGINAAQAAAALQRSPGVVFAEVDARVQLEAGRSTHYTYLKPEHRPQVPFPNDPLYQAGQQWGVTRIKAPKVWPTLSSAASVLVCFIDTGVMWTHPDLAGNLQGMPASFVRANLDDNGHGTHTAGIIGAVGNNGRGIAGTALKANMVPCKALDSTGNGDISGIVRCIETCRKLRSDIITLSANTLTNSQALRAAVRAACIKSGILFVNSAGNFGFDLDTAPGYPAKYKIPGLVAVANTQRDDRLFSSSNYGRRTVQLAAPGTDILSTNLPGYRSRLANCTLTDLYCTVTGTSEAAPFVAGAAALAKAASNRRLTNVQLAKLLMETSDQTPYLRRRVVSGGIINVERLIKRVARVCPTRGPCRV